MTFNPMPQELFNHKDFFVIMNENSKLKYLEQNGIKKCFLIPFTKDFSIIKADEFIKDILIRNLNVRHLVIGEDFKFGYKKEGDLDYLLKNEFNNLKVFSEGTIVSNDKKIGSSRIREILINGDFKHANKYLVEPFSIAGKVVHGEKVGRKLGFPTANIEICYSYPISGIFLVKVYFEGKESFGVASLGNKPTFSGDRPLLEVYIFNFNRDIYGKNLKIFFLNKIREQLKFNNEKELISQMENDCKLAKKILGE